MICRVGFESLNRNQKLKRLFDTRSVQSVRISLGPPRDPNPAKRYARSDPAPQVTLTAYRRFSGTLCKTTRQKCQAKRDSA
jgi:hypothetical protein